MPAKNGTLDFGDDEGVEINRGTRARKPTIFISIWYFFLTGEEKYELVFGRKRNT